MAERNILKATEGHILTNGTVYGTEIWLAEGVSGEDFHEITIAEYEAITNSEEATEDDYRNALKSMVVNI